MDFKGIKNQAKKNGATEMYYAQKGDRVIGIVFMPISPKHDKSVGKWNNFRVGFGKGNGIEYGSDLKPEQFKSLMNKEGLTVNHEYFEN